MAKSLAKVQKKISKKQAKTGVLHANSKDAQRLRRAGARAEKLERLAVARAKTNQPLLHIIRKLREDDLLNVIRYLSRDDEELAERKDQRRPGRPSSTREDLLKRQMTMQDNEYSIGFWIPDMQDDDNLEKLRRWNGDWGYLSTLKYVRLARDGSIHRSSFPPKGQS
ncbi:MAG: hypothetical protein Q9217_000282 [Psora testacea]